jgi:hypothetical protein
VAARPKMSGASSMLSGKPTVALVENKLPVLRQEKS